MKDIAIKVENVSKKYCRSLKRSMFYGAQDILKNMIGLKANSERLRKEEFWAVKNISFKLKKGETLGIIGPNGSGKTTLLKMLNGIFWPDKGKITVNGKVGALIEVGAGFHPHLTGRENIYINGAILGMNKKQIDEKFNQIVEFADIGDFLDSPVKHYSSGMYVRLGFSIAVHSEPDILLIDEVLAVGDRDFQIKCFRKMHELKKNKNVSIILISHNEYTIREYAQHCLVMDKGEKKFYGAKEKAISFYINQLIKKQSAKNRTNKKIKSKEIIKKVTFKDKKHQPITEIATGEKLIIDFEYNTKRKIKNPIFGINFNSLSSLVAGLWNSYENIKLPDIQGKGKVRATIDQLHLPIGNYNCSVVLAEKEESNVIEWKDLEQRFIVKRPFHTKGLLKLRQKWEKIE